MKDEKFVPPSMLETAQGQLWAQLTKDGKPLESKRAYEIFLQYCELEHPRSLRKLYEKGVGFTLRTLENYSSRYNWQARCFAYFRYIKALEQNARDVARFNQQRKWTERREKVREHEWADASELRAKAKEFLEMPLIETTITEETVSDDGLTIYQTIIKKPIKGGLTDVVRMLELADKLERNAVDAETDRVVITTPEQQRQTDVLKARAAFERSAELFPKKTEKERAEGVARAFGLSVMEIIAPAEMLPSIVQDNVTDSVN